MDVFIRVQIHGKKMCTDNLQSLTENHPFPWLQIQLEFPMLVDISRDMFLISHKSLLTRCVETIRTFRKIEISLFLVYN